MINVIKISTSTNVQVVVITVPRKGENIYTSINYWTIDQPERYNSHAVYSTDTQWSYCETWWRSVSRKTHTQNQKEKEKVLANKSLTNHHLVSLTTQRLSAVAAACAFLGDLSNSLAFSIERLILWFDFHLTGPNCMNVDASWGYCWLSKMCELFGDLWMCQSSLCFYLTSVKVFACLCEISIHLFFCPKPSLFC